MISIPFPYYFSTTWHLLSIYCVACSVKHKGNKDEYLTEEAGNLANKTNKSKVQACDHNLKEKVVFS